LKRTTHTTTRFGIISRSNYHSSRTPTGLKAANNRRQTRQLDS
jgi:hypothetical protein